MIDLKKKSCWIITEGLIGTENQCIGLAQALNVPFETLKISLKQPWKTLSPWLGFEHAGIFTPPLPPPPYPDIVIASGRKSIAAARYIKRASHGRTFTIYVQDPRIAATNFDMVIAPAHDPINGDNVFKTLAAPNKITHAALQSAAHDFPHLRVLPTPRIAVLIGGNSRAHSLSEEQTTALCDQLKALGHETSLMITTSRRTPAACQNILRDKLKNAYIWDGTGKNPYLAMLGLADTILVTNDSASMMSEAATTGKPTYLIPLAKKGKARRLEALQATLIQCGAVRLFDGTIETWTYAPLQDADNAAQAVREAFTKHEGSLY